MKNELQDVYNSTVQCTAVLYSTALYNTAHAHLQYNTAQDSTAQYSEWLGLEGNDERNFLDL